MSKVAIITDSTASLLEHLVKEYSITVSPVIGSHAGLGTVGLAYMAGIYIGWITYNITPVDAICHQRYNPPSAKIKKSRE